PRRAVRVASLLTLAEQGGQDLSAGDRARVRSAAAEFDAWAQANRQDAAIQRAHGLVQLLDGDPTPPADALQRSLALDPDARSVTFYLALARLGQKRVDEARTLLKAIPRGDPYYDRAQEQLRKIPD